MALSGPWVSPATCRLSANSRHLWRCDTTLVSASPRHNENVSFPLQWNQWLIRRVKASVGTGGPPPPVNCRSQVSCKSSWASDRRYLFEAHKPTEREHGYHDPPHHHCCDSFIWWRLVRPRPLVLSNFASRSVQCPQANYPPIAGAIESSKAVSVRATSASGEKHSYRKSCAAVGRSKRRAGRIYMHGLPPPSVWSVLALPR